MGSLRGSCFDQSRLTKGFILWFQSLGYSFELDNVVESDFSILIIVLTSPSQLRSDCLKQGSRGYDRWQQRSLGIRGLCQQVAWSPRNRSSMAANGRNVIPLSVQYQSKVTHTKDNRNRFRWRAPFYAITPHCRLNLRRCCKQSICPMQITNVGRRYSCGKGVIYLSQMQVPRPQDGNGLNLRGAFIKTFVLPPKRRLKGQQHRLTAHLFIRRPGI